MAAPTFNSLGISPVTVGLVAGNSAMGGRTSTTGNTCRVIIGSLQAPATVSRGPGTPWSVRTVSGRQPRRVRWEWQIKTPDAPKLNEIEDLIDQYIAANQAFELTDGWGRTSSYAVLLGESEGTRRVGQRVPAMPSGSFMQRWELVFLVLFPQVGGGSAL